jgi:hypothetical protein
VSGLEVLIRGCSSVGRAHGLQPWGQGFESPHLHQVVVTGFLFAVSTDERLEVERSNEKLLNVEVSTLGRKKFSVFENRIATVKSNTQGKFYCASVCKFTAREFVARE